MAKHRMFGLVVLNLLTSEAPDIQMLAPAPTVGIGGVPGSVHFRSAPLVSDPLPMLTDTDPHPGILNLFHEAPGCF